MIWQVVLLAILLWLVMLWWKNRKLRMVAKQMRTDLSRYPLIGDVHHFVGGGEVRMSVLQEVGRQAIKYNGWSSVLLGSSFYGFVADAEDAEYILKTHLEKDDVLKLTHILIGNGIIFAPVSIWRPRRKVLAPTFSQHNLNQFVDVFYSQSSIMVDNLRQKAGKGTFSIWKYLTSYTMDSVCQTTLGVDIGVQKTAEHQFLKYFQQFADTTAERIFRPWLHSNTTLKYLGFYRMYPMIMEAVNYLQGFVLNIIKEKRLDLKEKCENDASYYNNQSEKKGLFRPILELLIEASGGERGYTNNELLEESQVILMAGTDTSAVGAGFTAMMLARHPDVQEKVHKELHEMYGNSDRPIKAEDLSRLTYLEAVVKESIRLYPPVPITARKILRDDVTPSGIKLTSGMGIAISHWGIQRNPKYWGEDAEEFRPERFLDSPLSHPAAFIPFSTGPRNCLGFKYAMMSMMTAIANLVRNYRFLPADDEDLNKPLRLTYEIMMKHAGDYKLKLEFRS